MKVIAIAGNSRPNSSSLRLAKTVLDAAKSKGAETQLFELAKLNYGGCIACQGCKGLKEYCVVEDDLQGVLNAIRSADAVIFSSPVYFGEITGQLKCCWDRFYSFVDVDFKNRLNPGKKSMFIMAQAAQDESSFSDIIPRYEYWLKYMQFETMPSLRALGMGDPENLEKQPELYEQAKKLGENLVTGEG